MRDDDDDVSQDEHEILAAAAERLRRSERAHRRQRMYFVVLSGLAVLTLAMAVVNVSLERRASRVTSAGDGSALVAQLPISVQKSPELPAPVVAKPTAAPTAPKPAAVRTVTAKPAAAQAPASATRDAAEATAPTPAKERKGGPSLSGASSSDSPTRMARWMAVTYGQLEAERRATQAVTLYPEGDDRVEHWRKVLASLRTNGR